MNTGNMSNNSIPIKEYVRNAMSTSEYFKIIHESLKLIEKAYDGGMYVLLDINMMYIKNDKIQLQILFEDKELSAYNIAEFLKELTFACVFNTSEDVSMVTDFLKYLDSNWSGKVSKGKINFEDLLHWNDNRFKKTDVLLQTCADNGETGVLDPSYWDELVKKSNKPDNCNLPRFVNRKNKETIIINKDSFWIGKGDVDMPVNKDTISRKHAEFISRGQHYFIMDNDSTNKTYVNGKAIMPKVSVEIYNGAIVKFADEEYEFLV